MRRSHTLLVLSLLLLGCAEPEDAPFRMDPSFKNASLASNRVAVWPIQDLDMDMDTREVIRVEMGDRNEFLKSFSTKLAGRMLPVFRAPSLDGLAVGEVLERTEHPEWSSPANLFKAIKADPKPGATLESLSRLEGLRGVRYIVLCRAFRIERPRPEMASSDMSAERVNQATGFGSPVLLGENSLASFPQSAPNASQNEQAQARGLIRTKGTFRLAVLDLETRTTVMEETIRVEAGPDRRKGFYEVQERIVERVLARITHR